MLSRYSGSDTRVKRLFGNAQKCFAVIYKYSPKLPLCLVPQKIETTQNKFTELHRDIHYTEQYLPVIVDTTITSL